MRKSPARPLEVLRLNRGFIIVKKEVDVFYELGQGYGGCVWRCLKDRKSPLELVVVFNDDCVQTTYFGASTDCSHMYGNISVGSVKSVNKKVLCSDCALRKKK
jgi:hypothetical protein